MTDCPPASIQRLVEEGKMDEAIALLKRGVHLVAATGPRSSKAAIEAARRLYAGDLLATVWFMNRQHPWLGGDTPIQRAEESEEGLEFVIDMIGAIEGGVYV